MQLVPTHTLASSSQLSTSADRNDGTTPLQNQRTPLHAAAYDGHARVVAALLAAGADTQARDVSHWVGAREKAG